MRLFSWSTLMALSACCAWGSSPILLPVMGAVYFLEALPGIGILVWRGVLHLARAGTAAEQVAAFPLVA